MVQIQKVVIGLLLLALLLGNSLSIFAQETSQHITRLSWSPDGHYIAIGTSLGEVRLFNALTEETSFLGKHDNTILSMAWCGGLFAAGSGEPKDNSVSVWDSLNKQLLTHLDPIGNSATGILAVAWKPGCSEILAAPIEDNIHVFDVSTGNLVSTFANGSASQIIWDEIHQKVVLLRITDVLIRVPDTFQTVARFEGKQNNEYIPGQLVSLAWNRVSSRIAAGTSSGKVVIWDVDTTEVLSVLEGNEYNGQDWLTGFVLALRFSEDGGTLSSISGDGTYRVWDVATQTIIEDRHLPAPIYAADWSPDGTKLAYGGADGEMHIEVVASPTPTPLPTLIAPPPGGDPVCPGGGGEWVWIDGVPVFVCGTLIE